MSEETLPTATPDAHGHSRLFRVAALIVLALAVGLILWLVLRDTDNSSGNEGATAASVDQLRELANSVDHPVFWVGPKDAYTYELLRNANGSIFIRYLPSGADAGAEKPYTTIATYPFPRAFAALKKVARGSGAAPIPIARHGIVVPARGHPQSVHVAYPGVDYQVEVFDPMPGAALQRVTSGELQFLGRLTGKSAETTAATAAAPASRTDLTALATTLGHPIYWAGPRSGYTYEVTQDATGKVFIRYLPPGVAAGSKQPYLTVATYPFPAAFGAIQALANGNATSTIHLAGGGLAIVDKSAPTSIHLAYPDSDYQVEVFAPSAADARRIVESGRIAAIG